MPEPIPAPAWVVRRSAILWPAVSLAVALTLILQGVDAPLRTPAAPQGIVSYELAGTAAASQRILDSWDAAARGYAGFSLGLDFLYMPAYAAAIALACLAAADLWRRPWAARLGRGLAVGLALAAVLDAIENIALTIMLLREVSDPWPGVALWCAAIKFALVGLGLIYTAAGGLRWLVARGRREHERGGI